MKILFPITATHKQFLQQGINILLCISYLGCWAVSPRRSQGLIIIIISCFSSFPKTGITGCEKLHEICLLAMQIEDLCLSSGQLTLQITHLLMQLTNCACTTIHRIPQPRRCFIYQTTHCVISMLAGYILKNPDNIACSKDSVHSGKLLRIIWWEVRSQDTLVSTPPSQRPASCTGGRHFCSDRSVLAHLINL